MRQSGFSLIEVLLVVAVIGVLAGVAAVSVRGPLEHARLNNAVATAQRTISDTRRTAKRTDTNMELQIASVGGRAKISVYPFGSPSSAKVTWLPSSVDTTGTVTLDFDAPFGTFTGSQASIVLSAGNASSTLVVSGVLAQMLVKP